MKKKIAVCMAMSWDFIPRDFFLSYEGMRSETERSGEYEINMYIARSAWIDVMRDGCAQAALADKPDYIVWLDVDQTYQPDTILRLVKHVDDGKLVVSGVVADRMRRMNNINEFGGPAGVHNITDTFKLNCGLQRIEISGFGGVITHPSVFEKLDYPYFQMTWMKGTDGGRYMHGEDVAFYRQCKEKGIECWCDTDLHFGHLAQRVIQVYK